MLDYNDLMSQQVETILDRIEKIFQDQDIKTGSREKVVNILALKYLKDRVAMTHYQFDQLRTDNQDINIERIFLQTPTKQSRYDLSLQQDPSEGRVTDLNSRQRPWLDKNGGQMFLNGSGAIRSKKKQKLKQMMVKMGNCFQIITQSYYNVLNHVVCLKNGKSIKFQMQALYLNTLKKQLNNYQTKQQLSKSTSSLIDANIQFCSYLIDKVPSIEAHFVDRSEELNLSFPCGIFKNTLL